MTAKDAAESVRVTVTMIVLAVIFLLFLIWGWTAVTEPFPAADDAAGPECTDLSVRKGERVTPAVVTVSVLNASGTPGLAGQTMRDLLTYGFAEGDIADAPDGKKVPRVQIWTSDPGNPAVRLVSQYLEAEDGAKAKVVETDEPEIGINVVIGGNFESVVQGPEQVKAKRDATFCSPVS